MTKRRNFTRSDKAEMVRRATDAQGRIRCEACGAVCIPKEGLGYECDHTIAEALILDKSRKLTAADGKVLCAGRPEACHDVKTDKHDVPAIAQAKRREASHMGIKPTTEPRKMPKPPSENDRRKAEPVLVARGMSEIARRFGVKA